MNVSGNADISFIPRGNDLTTEPSEMARLSTAYRLGAGVEPDREAAMIWAMRAAAAGHVGAMNDLAAMYETGFHEEADATAAAFWYVKAAALGSPAAQHSLARILRAGLGIDEDKAASEDWLRMSADGGHAAAAADLADLIWRGEAAEGFPDEACFRWLQAVRGGFDGTAERCLAEDPELGEAGFRALQERERAAAPSGNG